MTRLRLGFSLLRCALFHDFLVYKEGWLRCATCRPIHKRNTARKPGEPQPVVKLIRDSDL